ncbi:Putative 2OG-Fe(II) oxygenase [Sphingomonas palmae]|uniref:Putative 2OG-Fe(II) oxygenase n=1 Tax=Sphingomonas palmae TaxID=1855283 RepID=A0A1H7L7N9_9SPHN|nr:putative 2OG-Fe(II) oxygenase [Sphingomonas palmae]SEK95022.1 Putative 2OG-Fe(II) oxygenase [Sphingomonas palmae]
MQAMSLPDQSRLAGGVLPFGGRAAAVLSPRDAAMLAEQALAHGGEERVVEQVAAAARRAGSDPRLWQWTALLHRALDDRRSALNAFATAARLAPNDVRIAHGLAQCRYEAGLPSLEQFDAALALAPFDGGLLLGRAAALFSAGEAARACDSLAQVLAQEPRWIDGQRELAHLLWLRGAGANAFAPLRRSIAAQPAEPAKWQLLLELLLQAKRYDDVLRTVSAARASLGDQPFVRASELAARAERGSLSADAEAFSTPEAASDSVMAVYHLRNLLRHGRVDHAARVIEPWLERPQSASFYPYSSLVWRLTGDPRHDWLDAQAGLVQQHDLSKVLPLDRLAAFLRDRHHAGGPHLNQSVNGGTQTEGMLLARIDPEIEQLREEIRACVRRYIDALPPADTRHPLLGSPRQTRPRFAGSWSVRLRGGGHHSSHVHPAGWISSALYINLPERTADEPAHAGWLAIGAPPAELGLDLAPTAMIEPQPGKLVLFPSTTWHGTMPFASGERLTVAFDIAYPAAP